MNSFNLVTKRLYAFVAVALFFAACTSAKKDHSPRTVTRGFYYWKSVYTPNKTDAGFFDSLHAHQLYIKFFDVVWNEGLQEAVPEAVFRTANFKTIVPNATVTPVVFITNESLLRADMAAVDYLSNRIVRLKNQIAEGGAVNTGREFQIDCDWTQQTKEKYFRLLTNIKQQLPGGDTLSATIRLYQLKYVQKTGIPPVDKGLLMCYNMGNLKDINTQNSIIEAAELKKYIAALGSYPLACDVAFPLFEWWVWFHQGSYKGLLYPNQLPPFPLKNNRYVFAADTTMQGVRFTKGDVLRYENSPVAEIEAAALLVNKYLKNTRPRVLLYHLDSVILSKYSRHELESIFNGLF
jgi:hypothetical protein